MNKIIAMMVALGFAVHADTMEKYMDINNNIPQMRLKPDSKSQSWARSAQSVLAVSDEVIAQTVIAMNQVAKKRGQALFCLPNQEKLDASRVHSLIEEHAQQLTAKQRQQTVSEFVIKIMLEKYNCDEVSPSNQLSAWHATRMKSVRRN